MKLLGRFSPLSDAAIRDAAFRLHEALRPDAIYLFGSHVSGVPHRDSDIDVMVVLPDAATCMEAVRRGYSCLRGLGLPIELHVCSRRSFDRFSQVTGSLHNDVLRKGVRIDVP